MNGKSNDATPQPDQTGNVRADHLTRFKAGNKLGHGGRPKNDISQKICRMIWEKHGKALENALLRMAKDDIKAIKFIAERAYGKMPTPVEHTGSEGMPIQIVCGFALPQWARRADTTEVIDADDEL